MTEDRISRFRAMMAAEQGRFILWTPVWLMTGIGFYFALPAEPPYYAGPAMLAGGITLLRAARRRRAWFYLALALLIAMAGFTAAQFRAQMVATPLLADGLRFTAVEGVIGEIEPMDKRVKIVLSDPVIESIPPEDAPRRLRISFRDTGGAWKVGDRVRMKATLFPLPEQVMPGSYDFARHFYFRGIGGVGFAPRPPEIISTASDSGFHERLGNLRHTIGEDMRARMPGPAGAVAAAMTIGETGPIPEHINDDMRDSGLAHMLSISGLHLGIAAGVLFFSLRLLLACIPPLALRYPIKKIAAALAVLGAFAYLLLAGSPVPAQRSFLMVLVLFLGYMLDRQGVSLRTLAIAASLILLAFPEALFGASFQLSFAATLGIVALYERFGHRLSGASAWHGRMGRALLGILCTSLVATLATAPFLLYNFNRFSSFGLLANMAVVPLSTFLLMPCIVLALLLMPLGLQSLIYPLLQWGMGLMLSMADWVAHLPHSTVPLPAPTDAGLLLCVFGFLWLCLMRERWRWLGLVPMLAGLATASLHVPADLLVSRDGRQAMVRLVDGRYTMLKGSPRSFTAENWLRTEGQEETAPLKESGVECSKLLCSVHQNGRHIVVVKKQFRDVEEKVCAGNADVLVAWWYLHFESCPGPKLLIGRRELETYGAHLLRFTADGVRVERSKDKPANRPWHPPQKPDDHEEDEGFAW